MNISANAAAAPTPREPAPLTPQVDRQASPVPVVAATVQPPEEKKSEPAPEQTLAALAEINHTLQLAAIGVRFEFDAKADTMVVKVVDVESGKLIRQTPSEEVLRIAKDLGNFQGLLVDDKV